MGNIYFLAYIFVYWLKVHAMHFADDLTVFCLMEYNWL